MSAKVYVEILQRLHRYNTIRPESITPIKFAHYFIRWFFLLFSDAVDYRVRLESHYPTDSPRSYKSKSRQIYFCEKTYVQTDYSPPACLHLLQPKTPFGLISTHLSHSLPSHIQLASTLLAHFQAADTDNHLVWLASAYVNAIVQAPESVAPTPTDLIPSSKVNNAVLRDLLQAACLGANVSHVL